VSSPTSPVAVGKAGSRTAQVVQHMLLAVTSKRVQLTIRVSKPMEVHRRGSSPDIDKYYKRIKEQPRRGPLMSTGVWKMKRCTLWKEIYHKIYVTYYVT